MTYFPEKSSNTVTEPLQELREELKSFFLKVLKTIEIKI